MSLIRRIVRRRREDSGFTLIELLVYCGLLGLVLAVVGSILIAGMGNQRRITDSAESATQAQVAANSIGAAVRSASALSSPSGTGAFFVVQTTKRDAANTKICRAYFYSATERTIRTKSTAVGTQITAPTAAALATWTLLAEGVTPTASGTQVFARSGTAVTVSFAVALGETGRQTVSTTFSSRNKQETTTCFA